MWGIICLSVVALVVLWVLYQHVIRPYRIYRFYEKQLKEKNYKSYNFPFRPFQVPYLAMCNEDLKKHKDSLYSGKFVLNEHEVLLFNMG